MKNLENAGRIRLKLNCLYKLFHVGYGELRRKAQWQACLPKISCV